MAELSTYKGLELPKSNERYDVGVVNKNNRIIDSELHKLDIKNQSQDDLFATKEELNSEAERATAKENEISGNLDAEITRAKTFETRLSNDITNEADRATTEEIRISKLVASHILNKENPHQVTTAQLKLEKVDNTSDKDKPVSAPQQAALDALYEQLTAYTRQKIADLIGGASTSMDTLKEVEKAMAEHKSVMDALDEAIGKKANAGEFDSHAKDTTVHVTSIERNYWNDKSDNGHTHDERYYTESEIDVKLNGKADNGHTHSYSPSEHTHDDRYYTESETNNLLSSKSDNSHTHDDRYYTESEINTKLNGKADNSHVHDDRYYTESEIDTKLNNKADSGHTHAYASSIHTHDDRYYTETEIDSKLSGKANSSHSHNYASSSHTHNYSDLSGRPTFSLSGTTLTITF